MNTTLTKIQDIIKRDGSFDAHLWIEMEMKDGTFEINDYTPSQLEGVFRSKENFAWTGEINHKPFPREIEELITNKMIKSAFKKLKLMIDLGIYESFKKHAITTPGMCNIRSVLLMDALNNKCPEVFKDNIKSLKFRSGSLGFIQTNGDIFYEYG